MCTQMRFCIYGSYCTPQSELPRLIPRNYVESDHECTSMIYFEKAGDNVTLTLYYMTLTTQKLCLHINKCDCSKTSGLNEVYGLFFFSKKLSL